MSDLIVRVRYHDIEVEVSIPMTERTGLDAGKFTQAAIIEMLEEATDKVAALIVAGRGDAQP